MVKKSISSSVIKSEWRSESVVFVFKDMRAHFLFFKVIQYNRLMMENSRSEE